MLGPREGARANAKRLIHRAGKDGPAHVAQHHAGRLPADRPQPQPGKVESLAAEGATAAASSAEAAATTDIICLCVPVPADVETVILGPDGVLAGARSGSLVVDFSTIDPATNRKVAAALAEQGVGYLDAPVSGGPPGAEAGNLTVMCGGSEADYARALPVMEAVGEKIVHAGPIGAGSTVKLINQMLVGVNLSGAVEGFVLGAKAGIDPELLLDVVSSASGDSLQLRRCFPDFVFKNSYEPAFSANLLYKDIMLALGIGRELNVRLNLGNLALQAYEEVRNHGLGEQDFAVVAVPLQRLSGVQIKPED